MKKRKILAGSLAAIMAGAALPITGINAFAQSSSSLKDYVKVGDGKLLSPVIVVGSKANVLDVLSASDVSGAVAGYATTKIPVPGASVTRVIDGTDVSWSSRPLFVGSKLSSGKGTLTSSGLPEVLASGTVSDDSGKDYRYDQYIVLGSSLVEYSKSEGDINNPEVLLQLGTNVDSPAMTFRVDFSKALPVSDPDLRGSEITLFGKMFTIDPTSTLAKVVLNGGGKRLLLHEDQETDVTFEGVTHNIRLVGISDSDTAIVQINGETRNINEGESKRIGEITVYLDDVFYLPKQTRQSSAYLIVGSKKLILEDGKAVKTGTSESSIERTKARIVSSSSGIRQIMIDVTAQNKNSDYLLPGESWTDTVFGSVKLAFGGLNPPVSDPDRTEIRVEPSGSTEAALRLTDWYGDTKSFRFAYDGNKASTTNTITLKSDSGKSDVVVVEGQPVDEGDYFTVSVGNADSLDYTHIFRVSSVSGLGTSNSRVVLTDYFSQDTVEVNLGSDNRAVKKIDGVDYFIEATGEDGDEDIVITWGDTTTGFGDPGRYTTVFPLIKEKNGARVAITGVARTQALGSPGAEMGDRFRLPTGYLEITSMDLSDQLVTLKPVNLQQVSGTSEVWSPLSKKTVTVGKVRYDVEYIEDSDGDYLQFSLTDANENPAIMVLEEKNYNNEFQAVIIPVGQNSNGISIREPEFTDGVGTLKSTSTSNVQRAVDRWGTFVEYNSKTQGNVRVLYPGTQAVASAAVGKNPQFVTASSGGTIEVPVNIREPFTKLDTEVNTKSLSGDLILVGGPCVNTLVSQLLSSSEQCSNWPYSTGIIREYSNAFGTGKKALVIAGKTKGDTRMLASNVMKGALSFQG